jgi:hypothetical protein
MEIKPDNGEVIFLDDSGFLVTDIRFLNPPASLQLGIVRQNLI